MNDVIPQVGAIPVPEPRTQRPLKGEELRNQMLEFKKTAANLVDQIIKEREKEFGGKIPKITRYDIKSAQPSS